MDFLLGPDEPKRPRVGRDDRDAALLAGERFGNKGTCVSTGPLTSGASFLRDVPNDPFELAERTVLVVPNWVCDPIGDVGRSDPRQHAG
jgi:hypothetical protein